MKSVQMPRWVVACLVIATMASLVLAVNAITNYTLVKPFTLTITTAPNPLSVEALTFNYNPTLNQWTSCTLQVKNSGTSPVTAVVYVYLKNDTSTIAQGQQSQTFNVGLTTITVTLTWAAGYTADSVTGGYVVIQ